MSQHIVYAAVASPSGELLVEAHRSTGNAPELAARVLGRLKREPGRAGRRTYTMDGGYAFRLAWWPNSCIFVTMERGMGDHAVWKLLSTFARRWETRFGSAKPVQALAAAPFASTLTGLMESAANGAPSSSADEELGGVHERLEAVRTVMADSIEKVVDRGEKISLLVDRAERLEANALTFAKSSNKLQRTMRWRAMRWQLVVCSLVCGALYLIAASVCGGAALPECRHKANDMWQATTGGGGGA